MRPIGKASGLVAVASCAAVFLTGVVVVAGRATDDPHRVASTPATSPTTRPPASDGVFRIFLAADGSDGKTGRRADEPVRTLRRAQQILRANRPDSDVEIRIGQGTYVAPPTRWTFLVPGHTVSFMPVDYQPGDGAGDFAGRPVFRGDGTSGFWLTSSLPAGHDGDAGLRFYYLRVERYDLGGLMLDGGVTDVGGQLRAAGSGHNGNVMRGMYFTELGSRWAGKRAGYAGIDLVNSRNNDIRLNHFVRLENRGGAASLIHGVYLAHDSSANRVRGNTFQTISGDPVRTRNASNDNDIYDNTLRSTGRTAHYSDWFCNLTCARSNGKPAECASHGNLFHDNSTSTGYRGRGVADWNVLPASRQHADCGGGPAKRVRTWDNR